MIAIPVKLSFCLACMKEETGVVMFGMMVLNAMHFNNIERMRREAYTEPTDEI